jgi:hypothetical protein
MSCNCQPKPCGCEDTKLVSPVTTECAISELCDEVVSFECVKYTGNDIYTIDIKKNERLDLVVKKLVLYLTNPNCFNPLATCQSIKNFNISNVKQTEATISYTVPGAPATITSTKLQWSTDPAFVTVTGSQSILVSATPKWTIINLSANTTYYVRLLTSTSGSADCCTSITLSFKTLTT